MTLVAGVVVSLVAGLAFTFRLRRDLVTSTILALPVAFTFEILIALLLVVLHLPLLLAIETVVASAIVVLIRDPRSAISGRPARPRGGRSLALPAGAAAVFATKVAVVPLWSWDQFATWGMKARRIAAMTTPHTGFLRRRLFEDSVPDYPLGFPLLTDVLSIGRLPAAVEVKLLHVVVGLVLLALVWLIADRLCADELLRDALTAFVALTPLFWDTESLGLAEMPLAMFALAALFLMIDRSPDIATSLLTGVFAGSCALVKKEGLTLAVLLIALTAFRVDGMRRRLTIAGSGLSLVLFSQIFRIIELPETVNFLSGNWRGRLIERFHAPGMILTLLGEDLVHWQWFGFWIVFFCALPLLIYWKRRDALLTAAAVLAQFAIYVLTYFATAYDPAGHIKSSFYRVCAALLPLAIVALLEGWRGRGGVPGDGVETITTPRLAGEGLGRQ